jgi:transposase
MALRGEKKKMAQRTQHSSQKKAQIALEAIRGEITMSEITHKYGVHPTVVNRWKRELIMKAEEVFGVSVGNESTEKKVADLEKKVGQLTMENDFLKKSWGSVQGRRGER